MPNTFRCECPDAEHALYLVVGHDGSETQCLYCYECARLAAIDWNGTTASIAKLDTVPCELCGDPVRVGVGYCDFDGPKCDACVDAKLTRGDVLATRGA